MRFVRLDQERVVYILTGERRLLAKSEMGHSPHARRGPEDLQFPFRPESGPPTAGDRIHAPRRRHHLY
jgi:hypothetical protein